ncbi:MAG: 2-oxo acid dehydrogenase subunit E2 [Flavobacteriaceae bacterium]|jgi:2-oxoglutarate dehydrogenase E2 component (dihydrolipoamide succinyltransferase)|nr:2-oxo acid dehydrogenase subunit E2 [Flavobacteriaceae bacterium]NVJ73118.1 2-oxo acid dehydrogenase subunit E2 [Flavobacteriaceae bacterium]
MAKFELKLPQMGESVAEATLTSWLKEVGETIELDEAVVEIATDKVDSEVPSEVEGTLVEKRFEVNDVVKVGEVIAVIETDSEVSSKPIVETVAETTPAEEPKEVQQIEKQVEKAQQQLEPVQETSERFYSPLVKNIAKKEGISLAELDQITGSGSEGRVTKNDILSYIENRSGEPAAATVKVEAPVVEQPKEVAPPPVASPAPQAPKAPTYIHSADDERIPLSRMGKLIADHMKASIATSAHVQSFIEVDVTNVVAWRKNVKDHFEQREGEKLTFTPIFLEAVAYALKEYPLLNISLEGDTVIKKKNINLGMAAALPDGNLIVPVIKNADRLNLVGMAAQVNDLARRARNNQLKPEEVQGGTYTVTNVGSFGSVFGTPIINQPQVGILALGAIRKVPAVIETKDGDLIGIRSKMFLSHSYDHRVVNGALGGMFIAKVKEYLENWDMNRLV